MEQKRCKNKKCQRVLPDDNKHKYCENCRNKQAKNFKNGCKGALSFAISVGLTVLAKGKISSKND